MPKLIFETPTRRNGAPVDPPHRVEKQVRSVVITNRSDEHQSFLLVSNGGNGHEIGRLYEVATEWIVGDHFYTHLRIEDQ